MVEKRVSRRRFLQYSLAGSGALLAPWLLVACGGDDDDDDDSAGAEADPEADPEATEAEAEADPEADPAASEELSGGSLIIYSGRSEELVGPLIERFREETGIDVQVQYAGTAELAATLLEEGDNTPADLYFAQDAGALGAVADAGMFAALPAEILDRVAERFQSDDGLWVGISGRARVVVYNREAVAEADMPASILDFTDAAWSGRLGWAPTNGSFQSFVTALREIEGEEAAREWLEGIMANDATIYSGNTQIVQAVIDGEVDAGFVNHYYLYRFEDEAGGEVEAANFWYQNGDPGALINVAGAGIIEGAEHAEEALALLEYMLSDAGQEYFSEETFEYPLATDMAADPRLVPLDDIETPDLDLSDLDDLQGTLDLLTEVGLI